MVAPHHSLTEWIVNVGQKVDPLAPHRCAAHLCFLVARLMGADPIILVGLDLSFPGKEHHAEGCAETWKPDFEKGQFHNIPSNDGGVVKTIPGFFDQSLVSERVQQLDLQQVAVAWIDCDLYASTVPVLDYLTDKLTCGSVLAFDDWRCYRNLPDYGEQRACREWLEANPQIELHELFSFGWHGLAFTVNIRETQADARPVSGRLAG